MYPNVERFLSPAPPLKALVFLVFFMEEVDCKRSCLMFLAVHFCLCSADVLKATCSSCCCSFLFSPVTVLCFFMLALQEMASVIGLPRKEFNQLLRDAGAEVTPASSCTSGLGWPRNCEGMISNCRTKHFF